MTLAIKKRKRRRSKSEGRREGLGQSVDLLSFQESQDYASNLLIGKHSSCYLSFSGFFFPTLLCPSYPSISIGRLYMHMR
jgi:hypothetical protein